MHPREHSPPPADWEVGTVLAPGFGERALIVACAQTAAEHPDSLAVVAQNGIQRLTHRALNRLVTRWTTRLAAEGVVPGARVGLCAAAEIEVPFGFLAILAAGGVVVPLDPALPTERLRALAEGVGCRLILVSDSTRGQMVDRLNDSPLFPAPLPQGLTYASSASVIPAKAGIQRTRLRQHWIPAYAGMTLWVVIIAKLTFITNQVFS